NDGMGSFDDVSEETGFNDTQMAKAVLALDYDRDGDQDLFVTNHLGPALLYQNNGVGSGQEVPHFHLHVVPRQPESDWGFGPPHLERLEREGRLRHQDHLVVTDEKKQTVAAIRRHL
ncbi:MAG: HIT domain-containing protein, partial [Pseudomonadales bacterium]